MRFTACPLLTASVSYDSFPRRKFSPEMSPPATCLSMIHPCLTDKTAYQ